MRTPVAWMERLNRLMLEVVPVVAAALIGGYLLVGLAGKPAASTSAGFAAPAPATTSGEDVTAMVMAAHAAVANRERRAEPERLASTGSRTASPPALATPARAAAAKPAERKRLAAPAQREIVAQAPTPIAPAAVDAVPANQPDPRWFGARWTRAAVQATRIDRAADVAMAAPSAVVRAGRGTVDLVASAVSAVLPRSEH